MQDLNDLFYFVQVVEHAGFAAAGRALGQPKSKLSRHIALLEDRLGVRLLQRSTRRFSVTEIGRVYYGHCKAMLVEADAAQASIDNVQAEPRGTVRIACPLGLLSTHVNRMLTQYMAQYPDVTVLLEATNRRVDVIAEGFDVALRVRLPPLQDSDLAGRVLGPSAQCIVASPALLARHAPVTMPADLADFPSLELGVPEDEHVWHLFGPGDVQARVHHRPRFVTRGLDSLLEAAVAGLGVVRLPVMIIRDAVASGSLARVLPDWAPRPYVVHAVFPTRRGLLPAVRLLIDYLAARFESEGER